MVAQHHAQLGLAVVVVDGHAQFVGEPADHFRVERFARTADHPQAPLDRRGELMPGGDQQAVRRGRARQVGDAQFGDDPRAAFDAEGAIVEGGSMAQRQRAGDGIVQAIGPARVGQVPEVVFRAQVDGIAHVALERHNGSQRHFQRLRRACGARGKHQQERVVATAQNRVACWRCRVEQALEIQLAFGRIDSDGDRACSQAIELGAIAPVGDHDLGPGLLQPVLEGLRTKGSEQS